MQAPKGRLCNTNHWSGEPHKWGDDNVATPKPDVATLKKKVATITSKKVATSDNVATTRRVSIRELNRGISKHFSNLPFEVTKNGKVIAIVMER